VLVGAFVHESYEKEDVMKKYFFLVVLVLLFGSIVSAETIQIPIPHTLPLANIRYAHVSTKGNVYFVTIECDKGADDRCSPWDMPGISNLYYYNGIESLNLSSCIHDSGGCPCGFVFPAFCTDYEDKRIADNACIYRKQGDNWWYFFDGSSEIKICTTDYSIKSISSNGFIVYGNFTELYLYKPESTLATVSEIKAVPSDSKVTLQWKTESEIDNAGFNVWRAEFEKVNNSLIPAKGSPTQGASYQFIDENVQNRNTYLYKLEDIDLSGNSTFHDPVSATPRKIY